MELLYSLIFQIPIPENLPPLTTIARFAVGDRDELDNTDEFTIEKSGLGSQQYSVSIVGFPFLEWLRSSHEIAVQVNGSLVVAVAANGTLDREQMQTHTIHLTVRDAARNQDSATVRASGECAVQQCSDEVLAAPRPAARRERQRPSLLQGPVRRSSRRQLACGRRHRPPLCQ